MKIKILIIILFLSGQIYAQSQNFNTIFIGETHLQGVFVEMESKIILEESLNSNAKIDLYLEVGASEAFFYNLYLEIGDTMLLSNTMYGLFHKERTKFWSDLYLLNKSKPINVIGLDFDRPYVFSNFIEYNKVHFEKIINDSLLLDEMLHLESYENLSVILDKLKDYNFESDQNKINSTINLILENQMNLSPTNKAMAREKEIVRIFLDNYNNNNKLSIIIIGSMHLTSKNSFFNISKSKNQELNQNSKIVLLLPNKNCTTTVIKNGILRTKPFITSTLYLRVIQKYNQNNLAIVQKKNLNLSLIKPIKNNVTDLVIFNNVNFNSQINQPTMR